MIHAKHGDAPPHLSNAINSAAIRPFVHNYGASRDEIECR